MATKQTVLIVDDDADIIEMVSERLTTAGFSVVTANCGEMARQIIPLGVDLVITDLTMPDGNGLSVRDCARTHRTPLIFYTGFGSAYGELLRGNRVVDKLSGSAAIVAAARKVMNENG